MGKTRESGELGLERCKCCMNEWKTGSLSCGSFHCVVLREILKDKEAKAKHDNALHLSKISSDH